MWKTIRALLKNACKWRSVVSTRTKLFLFCSMMLLLFWLLYIPIYFYIINEQKINELGLSPGACIGGSVTAAWPKHTNRDTKIYVQPDNVTAIHEPADICPPRTRNMKNSLFLLIIVFSATTHFNERTAIRETWGHYDTYLQLSKVYRKIRRRYIFLHLGLEIMERNLNDDETQKKDRSRSKNPDFKLLFMLGLPSNDNDAEIQNNIDEEVEKYGDVLQESFIDSYYNLTLKSIMMLKWISNKCNESVRYILKTDDDMYVNVPALVTNLRNRSRNHDLKHSNSTEYLLLGHLLSGVQPTYNARSKFCCPRYMYPGQVYPRFLAGSGYTLSAPAAGALYRAALQQDFFHIEDIYITGMCALRAVPPLRARDDPMFSLEEAGAWPACAAHARVTVHKVPPDALRQTVLRLLDPITVEQCERHRLMQITFHETVQQCGYAYAASNSSAIRRKTMFGSFDVEARNIPLVSYHIIYCFILVRACGCGLSTH